MATVGYEGSKEVDVHTAQRVTTSNGIPAGMENVFPVGEVSV